MKYVLLYESTRESVANAPAHVAAHRARWEEFRAAGTLVMIGPFANPEHGAMGIFTTREAAEAFAKGDSFVLGGVVTAWHVRDWHEVLAEPK